MKNNDRTWVEIHLDTYRANIEALKCFLSPDQSFMQIVKADAYGHGALEIAEQALALGARFLGVANSEEGRLLRLQGITAPILVLSPSLETEIASLIDYDLTPTISSWGFAIAMEDHLHHRGKQMPYHLKLDTGMHRSGLSRQEFYKFIEQISKLTELKLEGVLSHYAASENDPDFSREQEECFFELISSIKPQPSFIHLANSSALINGLASCGNLVRLGILSYGIYTHPQQRSLIDLQPVMQFKSRVSLIKDIEKGETCGYNRLWMAEHDTRYALIPAGYADGYDYLLGNRAEVSIGEHCFPVIGKISMDMITAEIGDKPVSVGDEVCLMGGAALQTHAENLVAGYNGSSYELLCQLGRRARRYYYLNGQLCSSSPLSRRDFVPADFSDSKLNSIIEAAVLQRLDSSEIGSIVYREMLSSLFFDKDSDIHYRKGFRHSIKLIEGDSPLHYEVETELSYRKVLDSEYFIVACAQSETALQAYLKRKDVEYRWLMDDNFEINPDSFIVSSIKVNELRLSTVSRHKNGCLELRCSHPELNTLLGKEVDFVINTRTIYPRKSHQMSIFITELTKGISLSFSYPEDWTGVECIPIFSGQNRYPKITRSGNIIELSTSPEEWIFPLSGVVFAY